MKDQSFSKNTLARLFQKRDFLEHTAAQAQENLRERVLNEAIEIVNSRSWKDKNPLVSFPLQGRTVFMFPQLCSELISRKLCENIKSSFWITSQGRSHIVSNLRLLLEEGVPYRVYRLDIKSFYESFQTSYVRSTVNNLPRLSPLSKELFHELLDCHIRLGGQGVPRGLSLSAILSDILMHSFDQSMRSNDQVYFYARYVDDIAVITSIREDQQRFIKTVQDSLPSGLELNDAKTQVKAATRKVEPKKITDPQVGLFDFDYLGYAFLVSEPEKRPDGRNSDCFRSVTVDIAEKKIKRFKTRISRSFLDYSRNEDFSLLKDRIKFLTKNFSVYNVKAGGKKLAGIYHSYPLVSDDAKGLVDLDNFLRNAVLSKNGSIFSRSSLKLTGKQKREILANSFVKGHALRSFVHFGGVRLKEIQECWKN